MITTRIASAAALVTFGFAALGGTAVAIAAPASAETAATSSSSQNSGDKFSPNENLPGTAGPAAADARQIPHELADATRGPDVANVPTPGSAATAEHVLFPHQPAPHSEHNGQGHKGSNNGAKHSTPHSSESAQTSAKPGR
jgi:hypothetical protein